MNEIIARLIELEQELLKDKEENTEYYHNKVQFILELTEEYFEDLRHSAFERDLND